MDFHKQAELNASIIESVKMLSFDGLLIFDQHCKYTLWNPGMESMSGIKAINCLGREAFDVFPFLKNIGEERYFIDSLQGGSCTSRNRPYNVKESGKRGFFDASYGPLLNEGKEVLGGICVVRNVTDRVIREEFFEKSRVVHLDECASEDINALSSDLLKALGAAIRQRRNILAISQEELAFRARLHRTYISDIERGTRNVALSNVHRIAQALDLYPWVLIAQAGQRMQEHSSEEPSNDTKPSP